MKTPWLYILIGFLLTVVGCEIIGGKEGGISVDLPPPPFQEFPRWSPDGNTILYYHSGLQLYDPENKRSIHDSDSTGIWAMDSNGNNQRKILSAGYADWSPDGGWVVYVTGAQIYKVRFNGVSIDTSSIEQLTFEGRNFFPSWSSNGEFITYDNTTCGSANEPPPVNACGILRMKYDGTEKEFIVSGRMPDWSPTDQYFLYIGLHNEVFKYNLQEASAHRLTSLNQSDIYATSNRYPKISPGGQSIAFQSDVQIWTITENGENLKQLTFGELGGMPDWSPNGSQIIYRGPKGTIWVMESDGSNQTALTTRPEGGIE